MSCKEHPTIGEKVRIFPSMSTNGTFARDPYAALRFPEYRNFILASFLLTVALLVQEVALGYEIYRITKDPLSLGLVGLAEALPFIALSLYGGHVADRQSKRAIILVASATMAAGSFILHFFAQQAQNDPASDTQLLVGLMYGTVFLIGVCRAFQPPAASSLRAFLVPVEAYENAATWSSSAWQTGAIVGPAAGGFLYAWLGFPGTLLLVAGLMLASLLLFSRVTTRRPATAAPVTDLLSSVKEGISFVWSTKPILYAIDRKSVM